MHRSGPSRCEIMGLLTLDLAVPIAHASFLPVCMGWYNEHTWCLTSTETTRLIRDGEKGGGGGGGTEVGREGDVIYLSPHCHHQNDSCIKVGSDESHFNVSVGSDGQSHRTVSTNHDLSEEKGEPKRYRTKVLLLTSQTGSSALKQFLYLPRTIKEWNNPH